MSAALTLSVQLHRGAEQAVHILPLPKLPISELVQQQSPAVALSKIAAIYNQCAIAHSVVGTYALEQALGHKASPEVREIRQFAVQLEALKQLLSLICIELPLILQLKANYLLLKPILRDSTLCIEACKTWGLMCDIKAMQGKTLVNEQHVMRACPPKALIASLLMGLKTCLVMLEEPTTFAPLAHALGHFDWHTNTHKIPANLTGSSMRYVEQLALKDKRLAGMFSALQADLEACLHACIHRCENLQTQGLPINPISHCTIGAPSDYQSAPSAGSMSQVLHGSPQLEIARGALSHNIALEMPQGHTQQEVEPSTGIYPLQSTLSLSRVTALDITSPTQRNFADHGAALAWLNELLQQSEASEQDFNKQALLLLKLLNPCYRVQLMVKSSAEVAYA